MREFFAGKLFDDHTTLSTYLQLLLDHRQFGKPLSIDLVGVTDLKMATDRIHNEALDHGLLMTAAVAGDLSEQLDRAIEGLTPGPNHVNIPPGVAVKIEGYLRDLSVTLRREVTTRKVLTVRPDLVRYFESRSPLLGIDVDGAFESIRFDVSEAGKCFALERSTGAVFHLVRCLEAGVRAVARCLSIPDPTTGYGRNWGQILRDVKKAMDARWPNAADRQSGDGQTFDSLHASLAAIKAPYRDATMHLEEKYTEEEARYVFEMVRGLMVKIAARMDEKGEPKCP